MDRLCRSIFRPINFNDPWKCFWNAVQILIVSMLLLALIFIIPAISMIINTPRPGPVSITPYYNKAWGVYLKTGNK